MLLGAGRATVDAMIDPAAGIEVLRRVGDVVEEGEPLARLHVGAAHADDLPAALDHLAAAIDIGDVAEAVPVAPRVLARFGG